MRDQMVRLKARGLREPEIGNLRQHLAFARDAIRHDHVKGGDAVGGHEEQVIAQVENLAYLAALEFLNAGQVQVKQCLVRHKGNMEAMSSGAKQKICQKSCRQRASVLDCASPLALS